MSSVLTEPVIRLRRSADRGFEDFGWTDNWVTFAFASYYDPEWINFGPLRVIVENHIQPHSGFQTHSHRDTEIVTYVVDGTLTHRDSFGHSAGVTAGEMQRISAGQGMRHSEENVHDQMEHNLQIWFVPERTGTKFEYGQLKFTPDERQGRFRLYISPDARDGSMSINTDANVYAGLFAAGDHAEHHLGAGRGAWIQIVSGRVRVAGLTLEKGDGAGITEVDQLNFEFEDQSETLLFDVRMNAPMIWK